MAPTAAWYKHHKLRVYSSLLILLTCLLFFPTGYRLATIQRTSIHNASERLLNLSRLAAKRKSLSEASFSDDCGKKFISSFAIRLVELDVNYDVRVSSGQPNNGVFKNGKIFIGCKGDDGGRAAELAAILSYRVTAGGGGEKMELGEEKPSFVLRLVLGNSSETLDELENLRKNWYVLTNSYSLLVKDMNTRFYGENHENESRIESIMSFHTKIKKNALKETLLSSTSELDDFEQKNMKQSIQLMFLLDHHAQEGNNETVLESHRLDGWGMISVMSLPVQGDKVVVDWNHEIERILHTFWVYTRAHVYDLGETGQSTEEMYEREMEWRVRHAKRVSLLRLFNSGLISLKSSWSTMSQVTRVPISSDIASMFEEALSLLEEEGKNLNDPTGKMNLLHDTEVMGVTKEFQGGELVERLNKMRKLNVLTKKISQDERLIPPIHMSEQNMFALFAPLLVPVALPLILGLTNEMILSRRLNKEKAKEE